MKVKNTNYLPEKEYIKTLEQTVRILQRDLTQIRNQLTKFKTTNISNDVEFNNSLKELINCKNFDELIDKILSIFKSLFEIYELEIYLLNEQNQIYNVVKRPIKSLLEEKVSYLEEGGIINWAFNNKNISFFKDLTISSNEKDLFIILIPIRFDDIDKGVLILTTPKSKDSLDESLIEKLNQISIFLTLAVDNLVNQNQMQRMNSRLNSLNEQVIGNTNMASMSSVLKSMLEEIKQPLLIIESNVKLIENGIDTSRTRFSIINEQMSILNEILQLFNKVNDETKKEINKSLVNINELMLETLSLISSQLKRDGIDLKLDILEHKVLVYCYPTQLSHAIISILMFLSNRHNDGDEIQIIVTSFHKNQVALSFISNGIGLNEDEVNFWEYPQLNESIYPELIEMQYICKVIEMNNGKFLLNSDLNKGITIKIIFTVNDKSI